MLVLSRKLNEAIRIAEDITIRVVRIDRDSVRLGVSAPKNVGVHREEVYLEILQSNLAAVETATPEQLSLRLQQIRNEATARLAPNPAA
ncbi:MAG: carbon storage regulator CsrA [Limisphaerales bacterium]|jgi:carbon storage regulator